jgi:Fis family transcriptional regulator
VKTSKRKARTAPPLAAGPVHGQPLHEVTAQALQRYLATLDGHDPDDLYELVMGEVEPAMLATVLHHARGNQSRAASILGLNRGTLRRKLREYGLLN